MEECCYGWNTNGCPRRWSEVSQFWVTVWVNSQSLTPGLPSSRLRSWAWLTQWVWRPPAPLGAQLETPEWYRKLLSWLPQATVSHSTVELHPLEEDVLFWVCDFTRLNTVIVCGLLCLPALRCPTTSARLPFLTLVMKAPNLPDSVILPPTTWTQSWRSASHLPRWGEPRPLPHL